MKVAIFDTGAGGELFSIYFSNLYPEVEVRTAIDSENSPYGDKSEDDIFALTDKMVNNYVGKVDAIVLACNTATAVAIDKLRLKYPKQVFIGFEPMIKTASMLTETGKIMVLATSATKKSDRYKRLKSRFPEINVIEPKCDSWATLIDNASFTQKEAKNALGGLLKGVDVIILACTHYVAILDIIQKIAGRQITVIDPFASVSRHMNKMLSCV